MHCSRCGLKMKEEKRSYHKRRKWVCPVCGRAGMQSVSQKRKHRKGDWHAK